MKYEDIIYYERKEAEHDMMLRCICDCLEDYGEIPINIRNIMDNEEDMKVLLKWFKLAVKVTSMEEFTEKVQEDIRKEI